MNGDLTNEIFTQRTVIVGTAICVKVCVFRGKGGRKIIVRVCLVVCVGVFCGSVSSCNFFFIIQFFGNSRSIAKNIVFVLLTQVLFFLRRVLLLIFITVAYFILNITALLLILFIIIM